MPLATTKTFAVFIGHICMLEQLQTCARQACSCGGPRSAAAHLGGGPAVGVLGHHADYYEAAPLRERARACREHLPADALPDQVYALHSTAVAQGIEGLSPSQAPQPIAPDTCLPCS